MLEEGWAFSVIFFCNFLIDYFIYVGLADFPLGTDFKSRYFTRLAPPPDRLVRNAKEFRQFLDIHDLIFFPIHALSLPLYDIDFKPHFC
jgi:hypothetical protein